jgi:hypothetical protein
MGLWTDAVRPWAEATDRLLEENKALRDGASAIAPQVVGTGVAVLTGQHIAGAAANAATTLVAKHDPDLAARIVLAPVVGLVGALVPIVATPILIGYGVYRGIKWIVDNA